MELIDQDKPKRSHTKSRNGCSTCKARRVKCDETRPACVNCLKRGTDCVYVKPGVIRRPRKHKPLNSSSFTTASETNESQQNQETEILTEKPASTIQTTSESINSIDFGFGLGNVSGNNPSYPNLIDFENFDLFNVSFPTEALMDQTTNLVPYQSSPLSSFNLSSNGQFVSQELTARTTTRSQNNCGGGIKDSYLSSTSINNKLARFYTETYFKKISPIREDFAHGWLSLIMLGYKKAYVYHMIMADILLDLYYELLESPLGREEVLNFENLNDYLRISAVNYKEFVKTKLSPSIVIRENSAKFDILAYFSTCILHMLYYLLNPSMSIFDANFFELVSTMGKVFEIIEDRELQSQNLQITTVAELSYYLPQSTSGVKHEQDAYFPSYLYDLTEIRINTFGRSDAVNYHQEVIKDKLTILEAIDILKNEYHSLETEKDTLRIFLNFPSLVSKEFTDMVKRQDQRCLIIVAHYLMLLLSLEFNDLIPRRCIMLELQNLTSVIDDEWIHWLDVPRRVLDLI